MMVRDSQQRLDCLYDIQDEEFFKTHALFSKQKHAFQIQLFFDEFECANPLGSKREYISILPLGIFPLNTTRVC